MPAVTLALALAAASIASLPAAGGGTLTWTETAEGLVRGKSDGMALTRRGRLFLAPRVTELGGSQTPVGPVQVWSTVVDAQGVVYLGTGPEGQILRIGRSGVPRLHFTVLEPMVTALAVTADGSLLVGTSPGGTLYRVAPDGSGGPWALTEERYVWDLAVGPRGAIYAGTGERGRILAVDEDGEVRTLFDSDESHIVSLEAQADGGLLAGGAGRGLVYRVDDEGHALVLHDDELPEVVALAAEPDGSVVAALVAPPSPISKRPALRLRLPDGVQVGTTDEAVGMLEESQGPMIRGTIEGLTTETVREDERARGRIVRIAADGTLRELWSSPAESPFCLVQDDVGRLLFGTGEPARLYRVEADGDVALLATLREAQLTGLLRTGRSIVLSTSNPAAAYRLEEARTDSGSYVSRPFDAGGPARWGSIRWTVQHPSDRIELYTRTGNSRDPDDTWSAWSPALTDSDGSAVVNPDGRYLQWRLRQLAGTDLQTWLTGVSVLYEPYNRPPRIDGFHVEAADGNTRKFHWAVEDPDDDTLEVRLEYRPRGADGWATAAVTAAGGSTGDGAADPPLGVLVWETSGVVEGEYEVRAAVTDQPSNPAGEGLRSVAAERLRVVVDRTPPRIEVRLVAAAALRVELGDALSEIRRLEVLEGDRTQYTVRSEDGVCDSRQEVFRVALPEGNETGWKLRGVDAAGNTVEYPLNADVPSN